MGHRANLIIVENGDYTLRYDHWCASRLDKILFWGAGYALDYFEAQEIVSEEGWLDEIWAEGGAVLDLDKKYLLWWGGEDILSELPLRRVYLKLQQKVWDGWTIEWAHRGIVDLAEYVGYPKEKVLTDRVNLSEAVELENVEKGEWVDTIGCFKEVEGEVKLFALNENTENYLHNGTNLVTQCKTEKGLENFTSDDWQIGGFPQSGFWIDEKNKTVEFWSVRDCPNIVQNVKRLWEDWDIIWYQDNVEFQLERLGNRIILPEVNEADLFKRLSENLLREDGKSGLAFALDTTETLKNEGKDIQVNPWLFKSHHIEQPLESKMEIWKRNFGE